MTKTAANIEELLQKLTKVTEKPEDRINAQSKIEKVDQKRGKERSLRYQQPLDPILRMRQ